MRAGARGVLRKAERAGVADADVPSGGQPVGEDGLAPAGTGMPARNGPAVERRDTAIACRRPLAPLCKAPVLSRCGHAVPGPCGVSGSSRIAGSARRRRAAIGRSAARPDATGRTVRPGTPGPIPPPRPAGTGRTSAPGMTWPGAPVPDRITAIWSGITGIHPSPSQSPGAVSGRARCHARTASWATTMRWALPILTASPHAASRLQSIRARGAGLLINYRDHLMFLQMAKNAASDQ